MATDAEKLALKSIKSANTDMQVSKIMANKMRQLGLIKLQLDNQIATVLGVDKNKKKDY